MSWDTSAVVSIEPAAPLSKPETLKLLGEVMALLRLLLDGDRRAG